MKKRIQRILAVVTALILLLGSAPSSVAAPGDLSTDPVDPVYVFTQKDNALLDQDVFAEIQQLTSQADAVRGGASHMTEQDYIDLIPQVIQAIESSDTYVHGSLQQNGYFLVWETTVGIPCCYDPRMEAKRHHNDQDAAAMLAKAEAEAQSILYDATATRSGPSSMKIGLIQPYWESSGHYADSSFNSYSPQYKAMWQSLCAATGSDGIRYCMEEATVDHIASVMTECGMVLFDSHGCTDYLGSNGDECSRANCSYLCLTTNVGVTSEDTAPQSGPFGTYYHCMKGADYAYVSGTCIANHMTGYAPSSFLYMGICLGMATDGMCRGLRNKGVEAVYGYSRSVKFTGDMAYMKAINSAIRDGSSLAEALATAKEIYGPWDDFDLDPTIDEAIAHFRAFPIVASSEDPYPGHGNVDTLQTVCASWSLYSSNHQISVVSNNEDWGSVAAHGYVVSASPAPGYYAASCTLLSGSATVARDGNTFLLTPNSDCTLRIDFAPKQPVTVTYLANGIVRDSVVGYVGEALQLPDTAPQVTNWVFKGWTQEPIFKAADKPVYSKPGASFTPDGDTCFYALYLHEEPGNDETVYELLSQAPDNWEGNYVISYGTDPDMYLFTGVAGSENGVSIERQDNATAFADTGLTLEDDRLHAVTEPYIFTMEAQGGYYSLQSRSTGAYYGSNEYSILTYNAYSPQRCDWTPGPGEKASCLCSAIPGAYPYLSFLKTEHYFWAFDSVNPSIRFWKEIGLGARSYSTAPDPFEDVVPGKYYYEAVQWAYLHEPQITNGTDPTHFSPDQPCTREQIVCFLWAAAGKPSSSLKVSAFTDVKAKQFYYDAVLWAQEQGITNGMSKTLFGVKQFCTRGQIVTFLWRTFGSMEPKGANPFQDVPANAYFAKAVCWAAENGITKGTSVGKFSPQRICSRAEAITLLYGAYTKKR